MLWSRKRCGCGCGATVADGKRFVRGHNSRVMPDRVRLRISLAMRRVNQRPEVRMRRSAAAVKAWGISRSRSVKDSLFTKFSQKGRSILRKIGIKVVSIMGKVFNKEE